MSRNRRGGRFLESIRDTLNIAIYETMGFWTRSICIGMCLLFLLSSAVLVLHIAIYSFQLKGKRDVIEVFETVTPTPWAACMLVCIQRWRSYHRRVIDH